MKKLNKKTGCVFTFILSCILASLFFLRGNNITMYGDTMGIICSGPYMSGFDWSAVVSNASYYGWGSYWYTFILYKITDNYVVIYYALLIWNYLKCAAMSCVIYYILVRFFEIRSYAWASIISAIASTMKHQALDLCNEYGIFVICWLTAFVLLLSYTNRRDKRKRLVCTIVLCLCLIYALMIHERLLALIISVVVMCIAYRFLLRESLVNEILLIIGTMGGIVFQRWIRGIWISTMWTSKDGIFNTKAISGTNFEIFKDFWTIKWTIGTVLTNIYKMILSTYGICLFGILLCTVGMFIYLRKVKKSGDRDERFEKILLIVIVFGFASVITAGGLASHEFGIVQMRDRSLASTFKIWFYERYYFPYLSVIFVGGCSYLYFYMDEIKKHFLIVVGGMTSIWILMFSKMFVKLQGSVYLGKRKNLSPIILQIFKEGTTWADICNVVISFFIIILLLWCLFKIKDKKKSWAIYFLIVISLFTVDRTSQINLKELGNITCSDAGEIYNATRLMEKNGYVLPEKVLFLTDSNISTYANPIYTFQFVLNRHSIVPCNIQNETIDESYDVCISSIDFSENEELIEYECVKLDENEFIYSKNEELIEILCNYY